MKTRDSCDPSQAIEYNNIYDEDSDVDNDNDDIHFDNQENQQPIASIAKSTSEVNDQKKRKALYVPKRKIKQKTESLAETLKEINKENMRNLTAFFEKENEKDRKHEIELFKILRDNNNNNATHMVRMNQTFPPAECHPQPSSSQYLHTFNSSTNIAKKNSKFTTHGFNKDVHCMGQTVSTLKHFSNLF